MRSNEEIDRQIAELCDIYKAASEEYQRRLVETANRRPAQNIAEQQQAFADSQMVAKLHLGINGIELQINTLLWVTGRRETLD
jgi:hypothetical protein